ncbi:hypothetical protein ACPXCG_03425 [Gordonia sp. DT218]|uniref:hypothetical protein n=1 Tax=Gordonia sp. DT218 TaxID=3416659 RepID=UPI003CF5A74B
MPLPKEVRDLAVERLVRLEAIWIIAVFKLPPSDTYLESNLIASITKGEKSEDAIVDWMRSLRPDELLDSMTRMTGTEWIQTTEGGDGESPVYDHLDPGEILEDWIFLKAIDFAIDYARRVRVDETSIDDYSARSALARLLVLEAMNYAFETYAHAHTSIAHDEHREATWGRIGAILGMEAKNMSAYHSRHRTQSVNTPYRRRSRRKH